MTDLLNRIQTVPYRIFAVLSLNPVKVHVIYLVSLYDNLIWLPIPCKINYRKIIPPPLLEVTDRNNRYPICLPSFHTNICFRKQNVVTCGIEKSRHNIYVVILLIFKSLQGEVAKNDALLTEVSMHI